MILKTIKAIILLAAVPFVAFCQSAFLIQGTVNPRYNGQFVKVYYAEAGNNVADSALVKKNKFSLKGNVSAPTLGTLSFGTKEKGDRIEIFLSAGKIRVTGSDSIRYATVKGNEMVESYERLAKQLRPADYKFFDQTAVILTLPEGDKKKAFVNKWLKELEVYSRQRTEIIQKFIADNPASYVSLYYLDKTIAGPRVNYETTRPYFEKLSDELKATTLGKQLEARMIAARGKLVGQMYEDFVSTTPDGAPLSLKEVVEQNKYTLLDFWASWCGPCRKENPVVVKTFNSFKGRGFTVLSVSLDQDAAKWKDAIEKDGMPWYHVSSLKGWKEPAAALYSVRAIPQNVLIDANGKIVATNLRGEALYNKMNELLK